MILKKSGLIFNLVAILYVLLELFYELTKSSLILYIYLLFGYIFYVFIIPYSKKISNNQLIILASIVLFLILNGVISILEGDSITDIIGSGLRFFTFPLLYFAIKMSKFKIVDFKKLLFCILIYDSILKAFGIIFLNKLYGGPFAVISFVPSTLNSLLVNGSYSIFFLVTLLIILSLKRSSWLLLTPLILIKLKNKFIKSSLIILIGIIVLYQSPYYDIIENRIDITLNVFESNSNERSISKRGDEVQATLAEIKKNPYSLFFGNGAGAGYQGNFDNNNLNDKGEFYHIHNMWVLILFRYGIIGILVYLLIIVNVIKNAKLSLKKNIIEVLTICVIFSLTLTGNVFFGGFFLPLYFISLIKLKNEIFVPKRILPTQ